MMGFIEIYVDDRNRWYILYKHVGFSKETLFGFCLMKRHQASSRHLLITKMKGFVIIQLSTRTCMNNHFEENYQCMMFCNC